MMKCEWAGERFVGSSGYGGLWYGMISECFFTTAMDGLVLCSSACERA
jgi:hypothetical protein